MTYTPINWQTGDTITAEKMNKMDNGWSASTTTNELYSGSMTVSAGGDGGATIPAAIAEQLSNATQAVITVDGTSYTCDGFDDEGFWTFGAPYNDYSEYSFSVYVDGMMTYFTNQNEGTYSVAIVLVNTTVEISENFNSAVGSCVETLPFNETLPFKITLNQTTFQEAADAFNAGKLVYAFNNINRLHVAIYMNESNFTITCITVAGTSTIVTALITAEAADAPLTIS